MTSVLDLLSLAGRVAIVTGGGAGIGRQLALGLAEAGADVVVVGRRIEPCEKTAGDIRSLGRRALALSVDVTSKEQTLQMAERTLAELGKIDILVNNAATHHRHPVVSQPLADWQHVLDVNVTGAFLSCQAVGPHMIKRRSGRIVNVGSVYGSVGRDGALYRGQDGFDHVESLPYATSKGAILNFTRDLAVNWSRYGITVNAISPGMFGRLDDDGSHRPWDGEERFVERTPLGRIGHGDDLKGAVVLLASDAGSFITGHNLVVDGGWTAW